MTRIGLLSDSHGFLDPAIATHFSHCDEVWHAGDFGNMEIVERLKELVPSAKIFRGVYGNIDGQDIRSLYSEQEVFNCEDVKVMMRHIGGYPPKYNPDTKKQLVLQKPTLFISGHSHILRIMYDAEISCLYMNPGACGKTGWHKIRTLVQFEIDGGEIKNCNVIELGLRTI